MTSTKAPSKSTASTHTHKSKPAQDAITLLREDHDAVSDLFAEYEETHSAPTRKALVAEICTALSVHAQIEEEIFYPAVKRALKDKLLVPEATVEHAGMKDLIAQLQDVEPDGEMYDAKVQVLSEYVKHHVKEEQTEMFPKAQSSSLDLMDLGAQLAARKADLLAQEELTEEEES
jgi:hemerythrin-like domain-containing protein